MTEVAAEVGDRIEAGQTIARLRLPELDWRQRLVQAQVAALEDGAGARAEGTAGAWREWRFASARAELIELAAAGAEVVSPYGGEVSASSLVAGRAVEAGEAVAEIRAGARHVQEAIVVVPPGGRRIEVGMEARVAVPRGTGSRGTAAAIAVSAADPSPAAGRMVRVALEGGEDLQAPDGAPCRIEIILGRITPLGLLVAAGRGAG